jgi:RHS repeat-associated protein
MRISDSIARILTERRSGNTLAFKYDGLNRQVSRTVNGGLPFYSVYDGWNLIAEYQNAVLKGAYLSGSGGLIKNFVTGRYYYQDSSGSTSHLASSSGNLLEWYRYDLQGTPVFYNALNTQLSTSAYSIRHLFTGQQWYSELGLYDLRNRFYSPDLGRFLQPDPIGFAGDPGNIYRYVGNNPLNRRDPSGLGHVPYQRISEPGVSYGETETEPVRVESTPISDAPSGWLGNPERVFADLGNAFSSLGGGDRGMFGGLGESGGLGGGISIGSPLPPSPPDPKEPPSPNVAPNPFAPSTPTPPQPPQPYPGGVPLPPNKSDYGPNWYECARYERDLATYNMLTKGAPNVDGMPIVNQSIQAYYNDVWYWQQVCAVCGPPPSNPQAPAPYLEWYLNDTGF